MALTGCFVNHCQPEDVAKQHLLYSPWALSCRKGFGFVRCGGLTAHRYRFKTVSTVSVPNDKGMTQLFCATLIEEIGQNFISEDTRVTSPSSGACVALQRCHCQGSHQLSRNTITSAGIKQANLFQSPQPKDRKISYSSVFYRLETANLRLDDLLFLLQKNKAW